DLVLQVVGSGRIRNAAAVGDDRVGGLLEEERRIALVAFLHLADVLEIVAADAIDATNRKRLVASDDPDDRAFGRGRRRRARSGTHSNSFCIHAMKNARSTRATVRRYRIRVAPL